MLNKNPHVFNPMAIKSMLNDDTDLSSRDGKSKRRERQQRRRPSRSSSSYCFTEQLAMRPAPPNTPVVPNANMPLTSETHSAQEAAAFTATRRSSSTREPRPKYEEQQAFFIWYHRTDLGEAWNQVLQEFERQFHHRRHKGGLQCKFYRLLNEWNVEKVRTQTRHVHDHPRDRIGAFGVVQRTNKRFSWMKPEHYNTPVLPQFVARGPSSAGLSCCSGCSDCD